MVQAMTPWTRRFDDDDDDGDGDGDDDEDEDEEEEENENEEEFWEESECASTKETGQAAATMLTFGHSGSLHEAWLRRV